jgi:hypothetical protein
MTPLHYDDLPKTVNECWELLGPENYPKAIAAFIKNGHDKFDDELTKFKKIILKLSGSVEIVRFFDEWDEERQIKKTLKVIDRDKVRAYHDKFVRYWILSNRRSQICDFLDAAGIPHDDAYINDNCPSVTEDMWTRGLSKIWEFDELFVKLYLGYILLPTRKKNDDPMWETLAAALGKNKPKASDDQNESKNNQTSSEAELITDVNATKVEDSGEFLLYEQQLIKSLAQGAISRTSSLDALDAVDMIRQLIDDAPGKPRLFFLFGFAQALHELPADLSSIKGITIDRQCWFYCGYLQGLGRKLNTKLINKFIEDNKSLFNDFGSNPMSAAFTQSATIISSALVDVENSSAFCELIPLVDYSDDLSIIIPILNHGNVLASELVSQRKYDSAFKLNSLLMNLAKKWQKTDQEDWLLEFLNKRINRLTIREAIIALGKRDFEGAKTKFGKLTDNAKGVNRLEPRVWTEMAKAGIDDFFSVFPSGDKQTFERIGGKMLSVVKEILEHPHKIEDRPYHASICAGITEYYRKKYDLAYTHFHNAAETLTKQGRSATSALSMWVRFMRSASQIMNLDAPSLETIVADFEAMLDSKTKPSSWFYSDLVESATVFGDQRLLNNILSMVPTEDGEKHFAAYESAGVLISDSQKRLAYAQWLPNSKRNKDKIFKCLFDVVRWEIASTKTDASLFAIDVLELLSEDSDRLSAELLDFIQTNNLSPDILDELELYELKFNLFSRLKRNLEADQVLIDRFIKLATSSNDWKRQQSYHFLEELIELDVDLKSFQTLVKKVQNDFKTEEVEPDVINSCGKIKILCVGGNEIQKKYEEEIVEEFKEIYPQLSVEFIYTGWTYNFTGFVDSVRSKIPVFDGIVLSSMVRTNFGRNIRKICNEDCPWWPCTGRGRDSIKRKIIAAASHAAKKKTNRL